MAPNVREPPRPRHRKFRQTLPIFAVRDEIIAKIRMNQVTIVVGETGTGKTGQIPQYLMEAGIGGVGAKCIACTQPRRVAATSVAERVAEEVGCWLGTKVGYSVRFDERYGRDTKLKYLTDGMLLREALEDPNLSAYDIVIVDEAHERSINTDVALGLLKELAKKRPLNSENPLRIVIMSATLDTSVFAEFFQCPRVLYVRGRTFPVTRYYAASAVDDYVAAAIETAVMCHFSRWQEEKDEAIAAKAAAGAARPAPTPGDGDGDGENVEDATNDDVMSPEEAASISCGDILVFLTGQEEIEGAKAAIEKRIELWEHARDTARTRAGWVLPAPVEEEEDGKTDDALAPAPEAAPAVESEPEVSSSDEEDDLLARIANAERDSAASAYSQVPLDLPSLQVVPLYAALPPEAQRAVWATPPPHTRRIILATNVAETSITIPTVRIVIDAGVAKQRDFNPTAGVESLAVVATSRATVRQRVGRAGRTAPGIAYHLYTEDSFWGALPAQTPPEILRAPLDGTLLTLVQLGFGRPQNFPWVTTPSKAALEHALRTLLTLGAVTRGGNGLICTEVGKRLVQFPLPPSDAAALLAGARRGVLGHVITIVAMLNAGHVFVQPRAGTPEAAAARHNRRAFEILCSDHLALHSVFAGWLGAVPGSVKPKKAEGARMQWSRAHFINHRTLTHAAAIRDQLATIAANAGLARAEEIAPRTCLNIEDPEGVLRALAEAYFMHAAVRLPDAAATAHAAQFRCPGGATAGLHPTSAVRTSREMINCVLYHELVETTRPLLRVVSPIDEAWLPGGVAAHIRSE